MLLKKLIIAANSCVRSDHNYDLYNYNLSISKSGQFILRTAKFWYCSKDSESNFNSSLPLCFSALWYLSFFLYRTVYCYRTYREKRKGMTFAARTNYIYVMKIILYNKFHLHSIEMNAHSARPKNKYIYRSIGQIFTHTTHTH